MNRATRSGNENGSAALNARNNGTNLPKKDAAASKSAALDKAGIDQGERVASARYRMSLEQDDAFAHDGELVACA